MNNSGFNKVDWINIVIFRCFQVYFNLKDLQALSMLSKLTRPKLKPILFKSVHLINQQKFIDGSYVNSFNSESFYELNKIANLNEDEIQRNLKITNSMGNVNSELQDIDHFVNSFYIKDINLSEYRVCKIITKFINLSVLKIHCSTIHYNLFQNLREYFPMLNTFELCKVILLRESINKDNSNEIKFPLNLENLIVCCVEETDNSISAKNYRAVINELYYGSRTEYALPNIYLPSLKKLQFIQCAAKNNGLEEFLEKNPSLEQLSTDTFNSSMSKRITSVKSLNLEKIDLFENLQNLTVHHNVKTLKISFREEYHYYKLEKVCLMCPSIEFLRFKASIFGFYNQVFNSYLIPILKKLPNLKTLELPIKTANRELEPIDINRFPQIKKIIFETDDLFYLEIYFEKNDNLKEIEINSFVCDINKKYFLEFYRCYTNWEFKFFENKVIGIKI